MTVLPPARVERDYVAVGVPASGEDLSAGGGTVGDGEGDVAEPQAIGDGRSLGGDAVREDLQGRPGVAAAGKTVAPGAPQAGALLKAAGSVS